MKPRWSFLLALPPLAFLVLFYVFPLASIFSLSIFSSDDWQIRRLSELVLSAPYLRILWFTTWQAALSTLLTLLAALPSAYVFSHYTFAGKRLIQSLTTVPFVLPTVVTAAAFHALLGPRGIVNAVAGQMMGLEKPLIQINQSVWFILLAHVFYNYTVVLRIVGTFWARIPKNVIEAARMLGASNMTVFCRVTLPLLAPAMIAASLLVFMFCFTSFGVVLILGGPRLATVEVEIYRQAMHLFNLPMASALSLVQIGFTFVLMVIYTRFETRRSLMLMAETGVQTAAPAKGFKARAAIMANGGFLVLLLGSPMGALLVRSLDTEDGPGLRYYSSLLINETQSILYIAPMNAVFNSLAYAAAATVVALILGGCGAAFLGTGTRRKASLLDPVLMLPLATSAVTLGFGFILALDEPPLNLRASPLLPVIAHALVAFPFVIRSLLPAWRSIPQRLREAATVLGASPASVWWQVDWPLVRRAFMVGAVFAFAISMGEFGASVFVVRPDRPTMPLAIFRFLNHPGVLNYGRAMAMSCLLMMITAMGFVLLEWRSRPKET